jgi:hypothetical protein
MTTQPRTLTALEMGYEPDIHTAYSQMYAIHGGYPVFNPRDIDPDDAVASSHPPRLYCTTDHGATWEPVGQYVKRSGGYSLQWF